VLDIEVRRPALSTVFPYTTLFRSWQRLQQGPQGQIELGRCWRGGTGRGGITQPYVLIEEGAQLSPLCRERLLQAVLPGTGTFSGSGLQLQAAQPPVQLGPGAPLRVAGLTIRPQDPQGHGQ